MPEVKELFQEYIKRAEVLKKEQPSDFNACLISLENKMVEASELQEGDRLELRAYMEEYRRQKLDSYEAGAENSSIPTPDSAPRLKDNF